MFDAIRKQKLYTDDLEPIHIKNFEMPPNCTTLKLISMAIWLYMHDEQIIDVHRLLHQMHQKHHIRILKNLNKNIKKIFQINYAEKI